jgi:hypothetical protein
MDSLDAIGVAARIADESKQLVKIIALGIRLDGSLLILNSDMDESDLDRLFKDHRLWVGEHLGKEMMPQA